MVQSRCRIHDGMRDGTNRAISKIGAEKTKFRQRLFAIRAGGEKNAVFRLRGRSVGERMWQLRSGGPLPGLKIEAPTLVEPNLGVVFPGDPTGDNQVVSKNTAGGVSVLYRKRRQLFPF